MDHVEDVERLFSWLKAPMVHYREFAPQREIADAVRTWPVAHRAAVETGVAAADEPAPLGDTAAKERIARDSMSLPSGQPTAPSAAVEVPAKASAEAASALSPADEQLGMAAGEPTQVTGFEPTEPRRAPEPTIAGFERQQPATPRPQPAPARAEPYEGRDVEPARHHHPHHHPGHDREALFGGEYRGRERGDRPGSGAAGRQDRSLDAVFSRLAGGRDRLPDPRARARTSPGLGAVFGRLR